VIVDLLRRNLAPILPEAWKLIDEEATRVLRLTLGARKLIDIDGPRGWHRASVNDGRIAPLGRAEQGPLSIEGVSFAVRVVQPLVEVRVPFALPMHELDHVARGARDLDLEPVILAAERIARAEDAAVFYGLPAAGITGIIPASSHPSIPLPRDVTEFPRVVAEALEHLRRAGVDGPFALALGPDPYSALSQSAEDGYPIRKRIEQQLIDGPLIWAPALEGGVVLSTRGGDFSLTVGQDISVGYDWHDKDVIALYLTESMTFRVFEGAAAVHLSR
jgi:uncharacterized linocin/CFP29 family protein